MSGLRVEARASRRCCGGETPVGLVVSVIPHGMGLDRRTEPVVGGSHAAIQGMFCAGVSAAVRMVTGSGNATGDRRTGARSAGTRRQGLHSPRGTELRSVSRAQTPRRSQTSPAARHGRRTTPPAKSKFLSDVWVILCEIARQPLKRPLSATGLLKTFTWISALGILSLLNATSCAWIVYRIR